MHEERFIVGASELVEAEYAHRASEPVTVLQLDPENAAVAIWGYDTCAAAVAGLAGVPITQIEFL